MIWLPVALVLAFAAGVLFGCVVGGIAHQERQRRREAAAIIRAAGVLGRHGHDQGGGP